MCVCVRFLGYFIVNLLSYSRKLLSKMCVVCAEFFQRHNKKKKTTNYWCSLFCPNISPRTTPVFTEMPVWWWFFPSVSLDSLVVKSFLFCRQCTVAIITAIQDVVCSSSTLCFYVLLFLAFIWELPVKRKCLILKGLLTDLRRELNSYKKIKINPRKYGVRSIKRVRRRHREVVLQSVSSRRW